MSDLDAVHRYNAVKRDPKFRLQAHLGPCMAEGDPENCRILILLANPLYHGDSNLGDHELFFEGWPLAGVHPDAPSWLRNWWQPRLRAVAAIAGEDWKLVSNKVAAINLNPWASMKFDPHCALPSRAVQIGRAREAAQRGALVIAVRARQYWMPHLAGCKVLLTRSQLCSYISPRNLGEKWKFVEDAMSV